MCATLAASKSVLLVAPTAPEVDGPMIATTLLVGDVLLRRRTPRALASSVRVPTRSWIFRPNFGASSLTA